MKSAVGKKSFFLPGETFPADVPAFIRRRYESVVVFHFPIAFFAPDRGPVHGLWIDCFSHFDVSS
jgi:hypothetical protein